MSTTISMPQLGESVAEGTIGKWLKTPGERVERDEPIVEIITDKVNAEIPSPVAGVIERIVVPEGQTVAVGAEIAVIGDGASASPEPSYGGPTGAGAPPVEIVPNETASPALAAEIAASGTGSEAGESSLSLLADAGHTGGSRSDAGRSDGGRSGTESTDTGRSTTVAAPGEYAGNGSALQPPAPTSAEPELDVDGAPKRASPFVRSLARRYGLDLGQVSGTGLGGRVTKDDILQFIERRGVQPTAEQPSAIVAAAQAPPAPPAALTAAAPIPPSVPLAPASATAASAWVAAQPTAAQAPATTSRQPVGDDEELVPLVPMRRAIAEHMVRSLQTSPHAWSMVEIDVTRLVKLRAGLVEGWKAREGFELTYLPFFVKAVVEALRENPILNARWSDEGAVLKKRVNIGIAVAIQNGLVVPVIRDADQKSISGIAREIREVATRARSNRMTLNDLQGGTFTVNNTGALGSIASGPIINQPQAGIITMEAIVKRPVVTEDDAIAIYSMMNSCLSFDHRVLDGAEALRFLRSVKLRMEAYAPGTTIY